MKEPVGYSKKSLPAKLGIKPGYKIALLNAPENYLAQTLIPMPDEVQIMDTLALDMDLIQFFTKEAHELQEAFPGLKQHLKQTGSLWISWPKKSSKVATNITEDLIRQIGLDGRLVDVKICAIDQIWSGLNFVYRLKDRQP